MGPGSVFRVLYCHFNLAIQLCSWFFKSNPACPSRGRRQSWGEEEEETAANGNTCRHVARRKLRQCIAHVVCRDLAALFATSDARGLAHLAGHACLLVLTGLCLRESLNMATSTWSLWLGALAVRGLTSVCHGILLSHLYMPLHESCHYTAFRSKWLCDSVAWLCGLVTTFNPQMFRSFHVHHHRYTQLPEHDPELPGLPHTRTVHVALPRHTSQRHCSL